MQTRNPNKSIFFYRKTVRGPLQHNEATNPNCKYYALVCTSDVRLVRRKLRWVVRHQPLSTLGYALPTPDKCVVLHGPAHSHFPPHQLPSLCFFLVFLFLFFFFFSILLLIFYFLFENILKCGRNIQYCGYFLEY